MSDSQRLRLLSLAACAARLRKNVVCCVEQALLVHSLSSGHFEIASERRNEMEAFGLMPSPATPDEGVFVRIPIGGGSLHRFGDLLPGLEVVAFERQRAQDFPPRFDQVEIGGIGGLVHHLPAGMMHQEEQEIITVMNIPGDPRAFHLSPRNHAQAEIISIAPK